METYRVLRFGFRGKRQLPLFMVWEEERWYNEEVISAHVLFNSMRIGERIRRMFGRT